jgi:chromosome segregation ATPase
MAEEIVGVKIEVDGSSAGKSIGQLRKEIEQTTAEVDKLKKQYGDSSEQAIAAQKKLQKLQEITNDKIEQQNRLIDDAAKTVTALSAAYGGVQGALELTGLAGEDTVKQLAKIQSALAIADAVQNLAEFRSAIGNTFSTLGKSAKTAFNAIKSGITSTGIGIFVVALGLIVANFDEIKKALQKLIPGLETFGKFIGGLVEKFTDFVGITSQAERNLESLEKTTKRSNEAIEDRIKILTAQGGKEKEIYQLSKQRADDELKLLREKLKVNKSLSEEELKQFRDLKTQKEVLDIQEQNRLQKVAEENAKKAEERRKAELQKQKEAAELEFKQQELRRTEVEGYVGRTEERKKEIARIIATEGKIQLNNKLIEFDNNLAQKDLQNLFAQGEAKKKAAEAEIALAKAKSEAEIQYAQSALSTISGLIDQNSAAGKAVAVVQAIINTYQGASKAIAQGGIFGPVAAAATIAAGLIQVRKIISTKIPSASGSGTVGGSGASSGLATASAPISPSAPIQNTVTQLNQSSINQLGSATSRAYVVESDITNSQEKITRINRAARLG